MTEQKCPLFGTPAIVLYNGMNALYEVNSDRAGGKYIIAEEVIDDREIKDEFKSNIARWIYEQNQLGNVPKILNNQIETIRNRIQLSVSQRADALLRLLGKQSKNVAHVFTWISNSLDPNKIPIIALAATESESDDEVVYFINYLKNLGFLEHLHIKTSHFRISPKGHSHLLTVPISLSDQVFVAMWFGEEVNEAYTKGIEPAIRDAGYAPMRIDNKETNNKIDDEIIAEIRKSKFLIADFTSGFIKDANVSEEEALKGIPQQKLLARGGVYYEAGFAQGLGLPVIWTCRADCIEKVHFDTRQYNHIVWESVEELYEKLKHRIEATII